MPAWVAQTDRADKTSVLPTVISDHNCFQRMRSNTKHQDIAGEYKKCLLCNALQWGEESNR